MAPLAFLSTLSLRRATIRTTILEEVILYFYPRSPCGERHDTYAKVLRVNISIHALLAESDLILAMARLMELLFLSTLSLRRATALGLLGWLRVLISIHALLAESDAPQPPQGKSSIKFLSTLSLRRATRGQRLNWRGCLFLSTLSLRRATSTVHQ